MKSDQFLRMTTNYTTLNESKTYKLYKNPSEVRVWVCCYYLNLELKKGTNL